MKGRSIVGILAALAVALAAAAAAYWIYWAGGRQARDAGAAAADTRARPAPYTCAMHPTYVQDGPGKCPFCGMDLTPAASQDGAGPGAGTAADGAGPAASGSVGVRIDPQVVQNIGVRTEPVGRRELSAVIRASGRIAVDEARQFAVNARVMGWAERLHASSTGQPVRKGAPLLDLYSPDLVSAQEEFLQALRYARGLAQPAGPAGGEAAGGHAAEARRAAGELLESARRRLRNWEVPESRIEALEKGGSAARTVSVPSPADGVVLEKMVIQGQNVMPGMPLYRIADLSRIWVLASVYQSDLARVRAGTQAEVTVSYLPGRTFAGEVAFVSPVLDPATRTAEVRIEVRNTPELDLKPEMFAQVALRPPSGGAVVAVPEQAVIRSGKRNVAIVEVHGGYFEPREVTLGRAADGWVEVLEGLREGERLVVSSQFLIDSESNLKAAIRQLQGGPGPAEAGGEADGGGNAPVTPDPHTEHGTAPAGGGR